MRKSKKWTICLLTLTLVTLILFSTLTVLIDPLLQYGKESDLLSYYHSTEIYSNPGIAKNYDYDTVLVGSSMVENTDVYECNEILGCNMIKVPYSGGSSYNHKKILDICFDSNPNIKSVYWSLDEYALTTDYLTPRYPLPEYLYDSSLTNDISYLLNLDVFYFYTFKDVAGTIAGKEQKAMRGGSWVDDTSIYNKKNMLCSFAFPEDKSPSKGEKHYEKQMTNNLKYNILPIIEDNPNAEFNFYMVPYSIAYWYTENNRGNLESHFYNVKTVLSEILKYDNVNVYFFQDETDIILNLNYYKDYTHFTPEINSFMTKEMAKNNYLLNENNYIETLDNFYEFLTDFDYDSFFEAEIASVK